MKNDEASLGLPPGGLFRDFAFLVGACLIGMALAAAAIVFAPETTIDPGLKSLAPQTYSQQQAAVPNQLASCGIEPRSSFGAAASGRPVVCEE